MSPIIQTPLARLYGVYTAILATLVVYFQVPVTLRLSVSVNLYFDNYLYEGNHT